MIPEVIFRVSGIRWTLPAVLLMLAAHELNRQRFYQLQSRLGYTAGIRAELSISKAW